MLLSTGSANYRPPLERSKSAPKLGSIEETIEEEDEDDSPVEEEVDVGVVRGKHFQCSPVGSIAISETTSDIVHYNTSSELSAAFMLSRSASQKSEKQQSVDDDEHQYSSSTSEESHLPPNRASNSSILSNSSCSSSSSSKSSSLYVYSRKITPSLKPPVVQRRFIRSISVDTCFDQEDDFDDDETEMLSNCSKEFRLSCRNSLRSNNQFGLAASSHSSSSSSNNSNSVINKEEIATDSAGEGISLTSTDTTDTVLDRPCTTEDTMSLMNSLSHSLSRQMSLPQDNALAGEESLTSDQPESLGSHSCNSSCGGCSDTGGDGSATNDELQHLNADGTHSKDHRLLNLVASGHHLQNLGNLSSLGTEEPDNISEESGYAEEKDFLQNSELTKALNA